MLLIFFFNDTATTEIYTLSLHDALPILPTENYTMDNRWLLEYVWALFVASNYQKLEVLQSARLLLLLSSVRRSEEHTSELQSRQYLVCRLLLEKKKQLTHITHSSHKYNL